MNLLLFRRSDFEFHREERDIKSTFGADTTKATSTSVVQKRLRNCAHQTNADYGQDHQRVNRFRSAVSRISRRTSMSDSPEQPKMNWFQRVFSKSTSKPRSSHGNMAIDGKQSIDNNAPTTCGNTASDETLSQEGASDEPFQSHIIRGHKTSAARQTLLILSSSSDDEPDIFQEKDDYDTRSVCDEMSQKVTHGNKSDVVLVLDQQSDEKNTDEDAENYVDAEAKEDDDADDDFVPKFDRQEIISALFPKGHPDEKPERRPETSVSQFISNDKMAALRHFLRQRKDALSNVGKMVLTPTCDLESVESPIRQSSASGSSACSHVTLDRSSKEPPDQIDKAYCASEPIRDSEIAGTSDVIGMEIAWDPTWELLSVNDSPMASPRTKLRTLQDAEKTDSCLLGLVDEEESSVGSVHLLEQMEIPSPSAPWHKNDSSFELGFHFDPVHFPSNCELETEINFQGGTVAFVKEGALKAANEKAVNQIVDSSLLWTDDYARNVVAVEERKSGKDHDQDSIINQTNILWKPVPARSSRSLSDDSHDTLSNCTDASAVVENLVGLCTKE